MRYILLFIVMVLLSDTALYVFCSWYTHTSHPGRWGWPMQLFFIFFGWVFSFRIKAFVLQLAGKENDASR